MKKKTFRINKNQAGSYWIQRKMLGIWWALKYTLPTPREYPQAMPLSVPYTFNDVDEAKEHVNKRNRKSENYFILNY